MNHRINGNVCFELTDHENKCRCASRKYVEIKFSLEDSAKMWQYSEGGATERVAVKTDIVINSSLK